MRRAARKHLRALYIQQLGKCAICGCHIHLADRSREYRPTMDHILALEDGGTSVISNLRVVHALCNHLADLARRGIRVRKCRCCGKPAGQKKRKCLQCWQIAYDKYLKREQAKHATDEETEAA